MLNSTVIFSFPSDPSGMRYTYLHYTNIDECSNAKKIIPIVQLKNKREPINDPLDSNMLSKSVSHCAQNCFVYTCGWGTVEFIFTVPQMHPFKGGYTYVALCIWRAALPVKHEPSLLRKSFQIRSTSPVSFFSGPGCFFSFSNFWSALNFYIHLDRSL